LGRQDFPGTHLAHHELESECIIVIIIIIVVVVVIIIVVITIIIIIIIITIVTVVVVIKDAYPALAWLRCRRYT